MVSSDQLLLFPPETMPAPDDAVEPETDIPAVKQTLASLRRLQQVNPAGFIELSNQTLNRLRAATLAFERGQG